MEGASSIDVSMLARNKLLKIWIVKRRNHACKLVQVVAVASYTKNLNKNKITGTKLSITLSGLTGRSLPGVEIDKGRGNANVLISKNIIIRIHLTM